MGYGRKDIELGKKVNDAEESDKPSAKDYGSLQA